MCSTEGVLLTGIALFISFLDWCNVSSIRSVYPSTRCEEVARKKNMPGEVLREALGNCAELVKEQGQIPESAELGW